MREGVVHAERAGARAAAWIECRHYTAVHKPPL